MVAQENALTAIELSNKQLIYTKRSLHIAIGAIILTFIASIASIIVQIFF